MRFPGVNMTILSVLLTIKSIIRTFIDILVNKFLMKLNFSSLMKAMESVVAARSWSDRRWATEAGIRPETLSRLRNRGNCDLSTLEALAAAVGLRLFVGPDPDSQASSSNAGSTMLSHMPAKYGRQEEEALLDLCSEHEPDPDRWRSTGPSFFMGGLAVMLASARGYDRSRYLDLAEALHPGITAPEVFSAWLAQSPVRPSRFLPMLEKWRAKAA